MGTGKEPEVEPFPVVRAARYSGPGGPDGGQNKIDRRKPAPSYA
jgi:hypothetical protein